MQLLPALPSTEDARRALAADSAARRVIERALARWTEGAAHDLPGSDALDRMLKAEPPLPVPPMGSLALERLTIAANAAEAIRAPVTLEWRQSGPPGDALFMAAVLPARGPGGAIALRTVIAAVVTPSPRAGG